jgi:hypothetical protein
LEAGNIYSSWEGILDIEYTWAVVSVDEEDSTLCITGRHPGWIHSMINGVGRLAARSWMENSFNKIYSIQPPCIEGIVGSAMVGHHPP